MVIQPVKPKPVKVKIPRNAGGKFHHYIRYSDDEEEEDENENIEPKGDAAPVIVEVA